uniref:Uncharacterized protein n=1 Tax=Arundo donax TaxID=35708 RepID=A0A0A9CAU3_ARUDO
MTVIGYHHRTLSNSQFYFIYTLLFTIRLANYS